MRIINTKKHVIIGVSPVQLMYGMAEPFIERGIFDEWSPEQLERLKLSDWMDKMLKAQQVLIQIALDNQVEHDNMHVARNTVEQDRIR